jgi:hypothetical protein
MATGALEIVRFRDIVPVYKVTRFVPGLNDLTLELKGEDFSSVEKVIVNDSPSPEFMIVSKDTIWATLPNLNHGEIKSIQVLSSSFTLSTEASSLTFELGDKTRSVSGVLRLLQLFTKWILQTPGTDIFNPERGGGLQEIVGTSLATKDMQPVLAAIMQAVSTTVTQIKRAQTRFSGLSVDERLLSAEVSNFSVDSSLMEATAKIQISALSGRNAISTIVL